MTEEKKAQLKLDREAILFALKTGGPIKADSFKRVALAQLASRGKVNILFGIAHFVTPQVRKCAEECAVIRRDAGIEWDL